MLNDVVHRSKANQRRAACDARMRQAGKVRMSIWVGAEAAAAIDAIAKFNSFDRGTVVTIAMRHLSNMAEAGVRRVEA